MTEPAAIRGHGCVALEMNPSPSNGKGREEAGGVGSEESTREWEAKESTSSAVRKDVALLKSVLAEDIEKREQVPAIKPKKLRRRRKSSFAHGLTSIREEAAGDVSSPEENDNNEIGKH